MVCGDIRTDEETKQQLETVLAGSTRKKQKELAKNNGSVVNPPLIPADFCRLLLAILHIILGITKKIWDNLIANLQRIDRVEDGQRKDLVRIRDLLFARVGELQLKKRALADALEAALVRKKDVYQLLQEATGQLPCDHVEEKNLREMHRDACEVTKKCNEAKKKL
jgi:hypothetical protein